jgi:hypothetical protein
VKKEFCLGRNFVDRNAKLVQMDGLYRSQLFAHEEEASRKNVAIKRSLDFALVKKNSLAF